MKYSLPHAFVRYHRGLGRMPRRWKPWLMSLLMSNMIIPFFFLKDHWEPWIVLGTALLTGATFIVLTAYRGFTRLLGFGHVPWIPMIVYLILQLPGAYENDQGTWFLFWLQAVIVLDIGSIILDAANVIRYFRGERGEMVAGLDSTAICQ